MNNLTNLLLLIGIVAFPNVNSQTAVCFGIPSGTTVADPQAPNQYYLCQNSIPIPMACPAGFVFCSMNLFGTCQQSCLNLNPAPVTSAAPTPAPIVWYPTAPTPAPIWYPTARTPAPINWYPTAPTPAATPAENPWFPTAPTLAPIENIPTAATDNPLANPYECVNQLNDIIFPIPGSCTGYATCVNGKPVAGNCLGNRAFDAATGTCGETLC